MLGRIRMKPSSSSSSSSSCMEYMDDGDGDGDGDGDWDPPSKIIKDDSLSIYEAILIKLKQGSQHSLSSAPQVLLVDEGEANYVHAGCSSFVSVGTIKTEQRCCPENLPVSKVEEIMIDISDPSASNSACSADSQSTSIQKKQSRNASVLQLFSKYKNSKHALSSSHEVSMME
ncbi:hypothetical protein ACFE04_028192 [Oxalis oulophora]